MHTVLKRPKASIFDECPTRLLSFSRPKGDKMRSKTEQATVQFMHHRFLGLFLLAFAPPFGPPEAPKWSQKASQSHSEVPPSDPGGPQGDPGLPYGGPAGAQEPRVRGTTREPPSILDLFLEGLGHHVLPRPLPRGQSAAQGITAEFRVASDNQHESSPYPPLAYSLRGLNTHAHTHAHTRTHIHIHGYVYKYTLQVHGYG